MTLIDMVKCDYCDDVFDKRESIVECPCCKDGHINLDKQEECCWGCVPCSSSTVRQPCYVQDSHDLCEHCECCDTHCTCPEDEDEEDDENE